MRLEKDVENMWCEEQFEKIWAKWEDLGEHDSFSQIFDSCIIKRFVCERDNRINRQKLQEIGLTPYKEEKNISKWSVKEPQYSKAVISWP